MLSTGRILPTMMVIMVVVRGVEGWSCCPGKSIFTVRGFTGQLVQFPALCTRNRHSPLMSAAVGAVLDRYALGKAFVGDVITEGGMKVRSTPMRLFPLGCRWPNKIRTPTRCGGFMRGEPCQGGKRLRASHWPKLSLSRSGWETILGTRSSPLVCCPLRPV